MLRRFLFPPLFSPQGFLARAVWIAAAYGVAHAAGLREYAGFLCGTVTAGGGGALLGMLYVALHFAFVLAAPMLVIGAGGFWLLMRVGMKTKAPAPVDPA